MGIITKAYSQGQFAVYWAKTGTDRYNKSTYDTSIEIPVRWDDEIKEFQDDEGRTVISSAMVMCDRDLLLGSMLWLGRIDDVTDPLVPRNNSGAREVRRFDKIPNLKNTETLRLAYL